MDQLKEFAKISDDRIDEQSENLHELSLKIWNKPELKYQETYAHELLTETLKMHGFNVTPQFTLETAFRAAYEVDGKEGGKGLTAGIICEYDALPEIGHACGHNLIAEAGIAAGLGLFTYLNIQHVTIIKANLCDKTQSDILIVHFMPLCRCSSSIKGSI